MRRVLIAWGIAMAAIGLLFGVAVLVLNATLLSAGGFVSAYLDAVQRGDAEGALELASTAPRPEGSAELLVPAAMGGLDDIHRITEQPAADGMGRDGVQRVTVEFTAAGERGTAQFTVERADPVLGLFAAWRFVESPLGRVDLTVLGDQRFTANGMPATTDAVPNSASPQLVFAPAAVEFGHDTRYLEADPVTTVVTPGAPVPVQIEVRAADAFIAEVQQEVDAYLDDCATQRVLLPAGCPFGRPVDDRVQSEPTWSIESYPAVTIERGADAGTWLVPETAGTARLVVEVRSIRDGEVSTLDEAVPYTIAFEIVFRADGSLFIEAQ